VGREEQVLVALVGQAGRGRLEAGEVVVAEVGRDGEQVGHVAVAQGAPELAGLAVRVEQGHERPDARGGQPGDDPRGPVGRQQPHRGALAHPRDEQPLGQGGRAGVGLGVGHALVAEDDERRVAPALGAAADELAARRAERREARRAGRVDAGVRVEDLGVELSAGHGTSPSWASSSPGQRCRSLRPAPVM
jgi:hypothetical protein